MPGLTRLLNQVQGMHWSRIRHHNSVIAGLLLLGIRGAIPPVPYARALLRVERCSLQVPDYDGMVGGLKGLIDALKPPGAPGFPTAPKRTKANAALRFDCNKRSRSVRQSGALGIVADDAPWCVRPDFRSVQVRRRADQGVLVTVIDLSSACR